MRGALCTPGRHLSQLKSEQATPHLCTPTAAAGGARGLVATATAAATAAAVGARGLVDTAAAAAADGARGLWWIRQRR
eukprot:scaffold20800_cov55-Phaeocystis_antarctica.AAC.1